MNPPIFPAGSNQEACLNRHSGEHFPVDIPEPPVKPLFEAFVPESVVETLCIRNGKLISIAVSSKILCTDARKIPFQRLEIILPVSSAERHAEKADNKPSAVICRHLNNAPDVLLMICQEGQERIQPYACKKAPLRKLRHGGKALRCDRYPRLDAPAQLILCAGDCHSRTDRCIAADFRQKVGISGAQGRLGCICSPKTMLPDQLQRSAGQPQFLLQGIVSVAHAAHGDHA